MSTPLTTPSISHGNPLGTPQGAAGDPSGTPSIAPNVAASRSAAGRENANTSLGTFQVKSGLAQMLKGGVIMDVVNAEQARIAEEAGACAVMALERVPADIRADGGVARMSDPKIIKEIIDAVTIPVMAKLGSGTLSRHRSFKPSAAITLTRARFSLRLMRNTISTSTRSKSPSFAARGILEKLFAAYPRVLP